MRIIDYPAANEILPDHKFLVDGPNGTHTVSGSLILDNSGMDSGSLLTTDPYIVHRNTYRGTNLGNTYTEAQKQAISSGTFDDIYVGDYWEIDGVKWRVMDFDYFKSENNEHHVVIWPDSNTQEAVFTTASLSTVGYRNSPIRISSLRTATGNTSEKINNAFGAGYQMVYKDLMSVSIGSDGGVNGTEVVNSALELPNTYMIFGITPGTVKKSILETHASNYNQFAALAINPKLIDISTGYWFRNIVDASTAVILDKSGCMVNTGVTTSHSIRPVFALKG